MIRSIVATLLWTTALAFGPNCGTKYDSANRGKGMHMPPSSLAEASARPRPNLRITYVGDSGNEPVADDVLNTIADFGPELVIHVGDFDYQDDPQLFMDMIDRTVGPDQKYIVDIGNHELAAWDGPTGYQARFIERHQRTNVSDFCWGETGVMEACLYDGILFVISGAGTRGSGHADFIEDVFSSVDAQYKVCTWHKNQRLMQIAYKSDEVGWDVYEKCVEHGAMVVNGHSHTYSRTFKMSSFENQVVTDFSQGSSIDNPIKLEPGESFLFVTGLGGRPFYSTEDDLDKNPWWAAAHTDNIDPSPDHGPTNCIYNIDGTDVSFCQEVGQRDGRIIDEFYFTSQLDTTKRSSRSTKASRSKRIESQIHAGGVHAFYANEPCSLTEVSDTLTVSKENSVVLQFPDMKLDGKITAAQVQVYSASVNEGEVLPDHPLKVTVSLIDREQAGRCQHRDLAAADKSFSFTWVIDDYEASEVWPSPNFANIVQSAIEQEGSMLASTKMLQLTLSSKDEYEFYRTECLAPTLAFSY